MCCVAHSILPQIALHPKEKKLWLEIVVLRVHRCVQVFKVCNVTVSHPPPPTLTASAADPVVWAAVLSVAGVLVGRAAVAVRTAARRGGPQASLGCRHHPDARLAVGATRGLVCPREEMGGGGRERRGRTHLRQVVHFSFVQPCAEDQQRPLRNVIARLQEAVDSVGSHAYFSGVADESSPEYACAHANRAHLHGASRLRHNCVTVVHISM